MDLHVLPFKVRPQYCDRTISFMLRCCGCSVVLLGDVLMDGAGGSTTVVATTVSSTAEVVVGSVGRVSGAGLLLESEIRM